jgi:hypothetical protein
MKKRLAKKLENRIIVGLAEVSSCYGGPEEGGWDYEAGTPVYPELTKIFSSEKKADRYAEILRNKIDERDLFRGIGVGGCGDNDGFYRGQTSHSGLSVRRQYWYRDYPRLRRLIAWPERRPHYE